MSTLKIGSKVLVRTKDAGVHFGSFQGYDNGLVTLHGATRIWRWKGANTLSDLSQEGADEDWTRISKSVPEIILLDAIEIIPCSDKAAENLARSRWG